MSTLIATVGVALLLLAFSLNLRGKLMPSSHLYQSLNVAGAGLACTASAMIGFIPFVVLEGAWALVGLAALLGLAVTDGQ